MPIENNKPPDPLISEFCELTGMDPNNICLADADVSVPKGKEGKARRHRRGIKLKVSTPGYASVGAGDRLKNLRSSKVVGKLRKRDESSPIDNRGGKRIICDSSNESIGKFLNNLKSGSFDASLKFALGSNCDKNYTVKSAGVLVESNGNDGSFIKLPLDKSTLDNHQSIPVAKSEGLDTGSVYTSKGVVGNASNIQTGCRDSYAIAKTGNDVEMAGLDPRSEHTIMEDVVNNGVPSPSDLNGIVKDKVGNGFEFGRNDKAKGILNKPIGPFFTVQFGKNGINNPFVKNVVSKKDNAWKTSGIKGFGNTVIANQFTVNADRFAEKLKQGSEELALKMEYTPNAVLKQVNGNKRIQFSTEEVMKGGLDCSLQLYGYFVGTSMDYRVVRGNLTKMWRVYGIEEITKTNSGIFYFMFKSEEGMKTVLDSGPWMVQNVPLVLNIWEPGIWLDKTEPTSIQIWVCVYNIPMEFCNGNGIGKIMSGIGKPMVMDRMTKERCLKKVGKLDFARVLVEVSAIEELPSVLEIEYPPIGNRPAKVGKLDVKYQWKPPLCTHCKTFGHTTLACKVRPMTQEEVAAKAVKLKEKETNASMKNSNKNGHDNEGFTQVGKNNRPVINTSKNDVGAHNRNVQQDTRQDN